MNQQKLERRLRKLGFELGCYTTHIMEQLSHTQLRRVMESLRGVGEDVTTDIRVIIKGTPYIIQIWTVEEEYKEMDFVAITQAEYKQQYGREFEEE